MSEVKYYLCSDATYQRLRTQTRALLERYPEDDGLMVYSPDLHIAHLAKSIDALTEQVKKLGEQIKFMETMLVEE
jgi:hypothetical protein